MSTAVPVRAPETSALRDVTVNDVTPAGGVTLNSAVWLVNVIFSAPSVIVALAILAFANVPSCTAGTRTPSMALAFSLAAAEGYTAVRLPESVVVISVLPPFTLTVHSSLEVPLETRILSPSVNLGWRPSRDDFVELPKDTEITRAPPPAEVLQTQSAGISLLQDTRAILTVARVARSLNVFFILLSSYRLIGSSIVVWTEAGACADNLLRDDLYYLHAGRSVCLPFAGITSFSVLFHNRTRKFSKVKILLSSNTKRNRWEEFEPGGYADCF